MLDQWTPEATVTVGGILSGVLFLMGFMLKTLGKRTDPELIKLSNRTLDIHEKTESKVEALGALVTRLIESEREQSEVTRKLIQMVFDHNEASARRSIDLATHYEGVTGRVTQALDSVVSKAKNEHDEIKSGVQEIKDTLTVIDLPTQLQQIADKIDRLQSAIDLLRADFMIRVEMVETEVTTVKSDVLELSKRATDEHLKVATQPTVNLPVIKEPEEKDKDNG